MHSSYLEGMDKRVKRAIYEELRKKLPVEERFNCIYDRKDIDSRGWKRRMPLTDEIHEENFSHLGRREHPLSS